MQNSYQKVKNTTFDEFLLCMSYLGFATFLSESEEYDI